MSSLFAASLSRSPSAVLRRRTSAEFFGGMIRSAREDKGLSLEETAPRAAMTVARWEAMEEGEVPGTREQLVAIAEALEADLGRDRGSGRAVPAGLGQITVGRPGITLAALTHSQICSLPGRR